MNLPAGQGLQVLAVQRTGPAAESDIRPGDVILEVNNQPAEDAADLKKAYAKTKEGQTVLCLVLRGDVTFYVTIEKK